MGNKKRFLFACIFNLVLITVIIIFWGQYIKTQAPFFTVNDLFIVFTLVPMLIAFVAPFISAIIYRDKKNVLINLLFSVFIYVYNYLILNNYYTPEIINKIFENSGADATAVNVTTSTDVSNMITTAIVLIALSALGTFVGNLITQKLAKSNQGLFS